jgi:hypothetical protein
MRLRKRILRFGIAQPARCVPCHRLKEDEMSKMAKLIVYLILSLFVVTGAKGSK